MNTTNEVNTTQDVTTQGSVMQDIAAGPAPSAAGNFFPTSVEAQSVRTEEGVWVPLRDIIIPEDARPHTQEDIASRAVSMAREGQEQNALLSREGGRLVLVYGHGRYLSAQKLGWEKLRCDIKEGLTESQKLLMTLAENEERENASPLYTGSLYKRIMEAEGIGQDALAERLGKDQGLVSKYVSLTTTLAPKAQEIMNRFIIGFRHCLEIAKLPKPEDQVQLAQECADKGYSVRELQARVKKLLKPGGNEPVGKETVQEEVILGCHFQAKGQEVVVRPRPYKRGHDNFEEYLEDIREGLTKFVTGLDSAPASEEVSAAA